MVEFVNAKINIGLNVVARRDDGYHELESIFYPVGIYNGTPENPEPFCDVIEITPEEKKDNFVFSGNPIDCPIEKNLVFKAVQIFRYTLREKGLKTTGNAFRISLDKHIPDGAGMGGGSADASFTLKLLNNLTGNHLSKEELITVAKDIGADCPFFIENIPAFVTGIGEKIEPIETVLEGHWAVIVKPDVYVSTKEAFAGIKTAASQNNLREVIKKPVGEWEKAGIKNDFEKNIFAAHPLLADIKKSLYNYGALYSSMSGSGSAIYGLFESRESAFSVFNRMRKEITENESVYLCRL